MKQTLSFFIFIFIFSCSDHSSNIHYEETWTLLVYMAADNDLDTASNLDIAEMVAATQQGAPLDILVQQDLPDQATAKRFRIKNGEKTVLEDLGEVDMASAETLQSFLEWANLESSNEKTALVLWSHGNGWDQGDEVRPRSIFTDKDNGSLFLANDLVRQAIQSSGASINLLGMDACTMGTIEALYEFSTIDSVEVIIGSQENVSEYGWDYSAIISAIKNSPAMETGTLAEEIVFSFQNFYDGLHSQAPQYNFSTIAAMKTEHIRAVSSIVHLFAADMIENLNDPLLKEDALDLLADTLASTQKINQNEPYIYIDLIDFFEKTGENEYRQSLLESASEGIIAEYHGQGCPRANGISIVFFDLPEAYNYRTFDSNYKNYDPISNTGNHGLFINHYSWDELLHLYYTEAGLYQ